MRTQLIVWTIVLSLLGTYQQSQAGDKDNVHEVGTGLNLTGKLGKVSVITYKIKFVGEKSYVINMSSQNPKTFLPFLRLLGVNGGLLAEDKDSGADRNARLILQARVTEICQVVATSVGTCQGQFTLTVREGADELAVQTKLWPPGHWKVVDFCLALADAENFAKMKPRLRAQLARADQSNNKLFDLYKAGKFREAVNPARDVLAIRKEVLGEKHPNVAFSLTNLAQLYQVQWNYAEAEPLYLKALDIYTEALGEKHPRFANCIHNLAQLYQSQGKDAKAEFLYLKALAIQREVQGEKHPDFATSLNGLALLYKSQGKYAKAEPLYLKSLSICAQSLSEKHPHFASSLSNLASLYTAQGRYAKAEPLYQQALDIRKEVIGEKHFDFALSLDKLAGLHHAQGNYAKAEPLYQQALDIRKEVGGEKHPDFALSLSNLAGLYYEQGNHLKAEPLFQRALDIRKEVEGEKHPDFALSLINLGDLYNTQGNYAKAEPLYLKALDILKEVLGEKHPDFALCLNNLAFLNYAQGNYSKAELLFQKALDILREGPGEKHPHFARNLSNLASLYQAQGNNAKAEPIYRKALDITEEVQGEKSPDFASGLNNMAFLYHQQRNYAKAKSLYQKALNIRKEVQGEKHPEFSKTLNNLAWLYHSQGNDVEAEFLLQKALDLRKEVLGEKHPDFAVSLSNLGALYATQGNDAKAESLYRSAVVASQISNHPVSMEKLQAEDLRLDPNTIQFVQNHALCVQRSTAKNSTAERVRAGDRSFVLAINVLDRMRQGYREAQESKIFQTAAKHDLFPRRIKTLRQLWALEQKPEDLEAAFWTAEQGTARSFLDSLGNTRAPLLASVSRELQAEEEKLLQHIRLLDLHIDKESARPLATRDSALVGQLLIQRRNAEKEMQQLIARMEKDYPQYVGLKYPQPCTLEQARACLEFDEVALLFVPGTEASFLILVEARPKADDKSNGLAIFELPAAATLSKRVASLTDLETLALPARVKALGRRAYTELLGPCKERLKDKHLVIVPGGSLSLLPFELLVGDDGKYLIEKHRIRYAPSLTALHLINLWKQKRSAPTEALFAVGDPIYDAKDERVGKAASKPVTVASASKDGLRELFWREGNRDGFTRLLHSGTEVAEIAKLLGGGSVLTDDKASEARVKKAPALSNARYVHFATHGILGLDKGKQPALVLNLVGNDAEDGFLEMGEVLNLKLNADLVVLSACRTGQGRLTNGEGVTGLARAFLYAGSKGVVCSLWSVDDRVTSDLMVDFYKRLHKGESAPAALRAAQLALIDTGRAPIFWAPFILIGE